MPLTTVINKIEDLEKNQQKVELQTKIDLKKYQKFKKEQQKQEKEIKKEQKKLNYKRR